MAKNSDNGKRSPQWRKALRKKAEQKVRGTDHLPLAEMSDADIAAAVHELRVHQEELEMQNESLRQAQVELDESRTKYADLFEFAPVGYLVVDPGGIIREANLTAAGMLGVERGRVIDKSLNPFLTPASRDPWRFHYGAVFKTGTPQETELQIKQAEDQPVMSVRVRSRPVENGGGKVIQCRTAMIDITDRVHAEEKHTTVIRNLQDGFCILDPEGHYLEVNEAYSRMLGMDRDDLLCLTVWDVLGPDLHPVLAGHVQRAFEQGWDKFPIDHRRKDGGLVNCDVTLQRLDGDRLFVFARDVTAQRVAEAQRLEGLRRLEMVAAATRDGIWDWDLATDTLWRNEAFAAICGYPAGEVDNTSEWWQEHLHPEDREAVLASLDEVVQNHGDQWSAQYRLRRKNGSYARVIDRGYVLRDEQGKAVRIVGAMTDLTERLDLLDQLEQERTKLEERVRARTTELNRTIETLNQEAAEKVEAQDQLMHQNQMLQTIINNIPVMLCFFDTAGNVGLINDEFTRILGYSLQDFREHGLLELAGSDPERRQQMWDHMMTPEPRWQDFCARTREAGEVLSSWATVRLPDGSYVGIGIDIRERRQIEDRLRESEERYRTLVELSPDAIGVERDGVIQFVNTTAVKLLGARGVEDLVGRPLLDFVHADSQPRADRLFRYLRQRRKPLSPTEERIVRLDGRTLDIEMAAMPIVFEGRPANQIVLRDITQRKQVEARLRENARQLEQQAELLNLAHDSIVVNDMEGRIVFWNHGAEQTFGWTRDEAVGKISHDLLQTRFPANLIEITARLLSQGRWNGELTHTTKDGRTIIVSSRWALQRAEDSLPTGILVIDRDVTQQKRAEQATIEARRFAESITNTVQESLLVLDPDLKVISANETFYRVFQVRPEETQDRYVYEIGNGQWDIPELRTLLEDILPGNSSFEDYEVEHDFERIGPRTMLLNARRIYRQEQETEMILLAIQDITVRKEQERKIREHQRELASLTEQLLLAEERERHRLALVLHDSIGQSLAFSRRELGVLQKKSADGVREALEYVKEQIELAIRQTRDLTFELSPTTLHTFGLEAAVEELAEQFSAREHFRYQIEATEEDRPLTEQIKTLLYRAAREVLLNIIKHANATNVSIHIDRVDESLRMIIEDDGRGFDVSRLEQIAHQQDGFGLFSIRERLTYVGGAFAIESRPGEGTKVTLIAPLDVTQKTD